jgi:hypothetical protein
MHPIACPYRGAGRSRRERRADRVSRTVADLLGASDYSLQDLGEHVLRGDPGRWVLFSVSPSWVIHNDLPGNAWVEPPGQYDASSTRLGARYMACAGLAN